MQLELQGVLAGGVLEPAGALSSSVLVDAIPYQAPLSDVRQLIGYYLTHTAEVADYSKDANARSRNS